MELTRADLSPPHRAASAAAWASPPLSRRSVSLFADALLVKIGEAIFPTIDVAEHVCGPPSMRNGPVAIDGTYEG
jgi:hypothetical protein